MKTIWVILMGVWMIGATQAQITTRSPDELDTLCASIALYPDELLAVMLPAATAPADIVLAARFNQAGGTAAQVDSQTWDDSVKVLTHYPELTQWMADNLEWTKAIGVAFREQPADVMAAIQRLRARARAVGNLTDTSQQRIVTEQTIIRILPQNTEVVYVPAYDPALVYTVTLGPGCSWLTFDMSWQVGVWPHYDFDWHRNRVCIRERHPAWREPIEVWRPWHPTTAPQHPTLATSRSAPTLRPPTTRPASHVPVPTTTVTTHTGASITTPSIIQQKHEPQPWHHGETEKINSSYTTHIRTPVASNPAPISQPTRVIQSAPPATRSAVPFESRVVHSAPQVVTGTTPPGVNAHGNGGRWGNVASTTSH